MPRQRRAGAHRALDLTPPQQAHPGGHRRQDRQHQAEDVARRGYRELGHELDDGDRGGQQAERGALPGQERPLVGKREPVIGLLFPLGTGACVVAGALAQLLAAFLRSMSARAAASSARCAADVSHASLRFLTTLAGAPTAIE